MVQNTSKPVGRPRKYDADQALVRALEAFWEKGYSAISLDELATAMGMNKPSIYAGFGDKKALYLKALEHYRAMGRASVTALLGSTGSLREGLRAVAFDAIDNYVGGERGSRGCFMVSTAVTEAPSDPDILSAVSDSFDEFDDVLTKRFAAAQDAGEPTLDAPPAVLGRIAADSIYGLALRARSGASRSVLRRSIGKTISLLCGEAARG